MNYTYFLNFIYSPFTKVIHFFLLPLIFYFFIYFIIISDSNMIYLTLMLLFIFSFFTINIYKMSPLTLKDIIFPVPKDKFFKFAFIQNMTLEEQNQNSEQFIKYILDNFKNNENEIHSIKLHYFNYLIETYSYNSIFIFKEHTLD